MNSRLMLVNPVKETNIDMLKTMLAKTNITTEQLFFAAKTLINITGNAAQNLEMAKLLINHQRFDPNFEEVETITYNQVQYPCYFTYERKYSALTELAVEAKNYDFLNLILKHPLLDLERVKAKWFNKIVDLKYFDLVSYLFKNPRFFFLEKDWVKWKYPDCKGDINEDFLKILAANLCWHKFKEFQPSFLLHLCKDAVFEIMDKYYQVSYTSTLNNFFTRQKELALKKENIITTSFDLSFLL